MSPPITPKCWPLLKYVGKVPKDDQENKCREKLCHIVKNSGCFYEICPEKLYLIYLAKDEDLDTFLGQIDQETSPFIFWTARENPSLHYEPFNMDFGPFNLAVTHQFCSRIKVWLDTLKYRNPDKHIVIVLDDSDAERKLNVTLLVAISAMVLLGMTDEEVLQKLNFFMMYNGRMGEVTKQLVFREKKKFSDVGGNPSIMTVTLDDCIKAFYAALRLKFYDYYEFDHIEYLFYETVLSGDLNWIVPGKLLAFAGPGFSPFFVRHSPEFYYHYFKDHNVSSIVRLNDPEYEKSDFEKLGFVHHDLFFPDGYPPTSPIAAKFIKIVDDAEGAVAVHCYAGIGRTGTLIAAYLMARYDFTPQMAVAWTRICRPGSVIGEQQDWLLTKFNQYKDLSSIPTQPITSPKPVKAQQQKGRKSSDTNSSRGTERSGKQDKSDDAQDQSDAEPTTYAKAEKVYGQARALMMAKEKREFSSPDRPRTRNHDKNQLKRQSLRQASTEIKVLSMGHTKGTKQKAEDIVLDLGKTTPWILYEDDIFPLKGKKNPEIYRLRDGKYEWKVKFPRSDYVALKHSYELNKAGDDVTADTDESLVGRVSLDFIYEPADQQEATRTLSKKTKCKATIANNKNPGNDIPRLKPTVLYTLLLAFCYIKL